MKPEEPTKPGAVVLDYYGRLWVRCPGDSDREWDSGGETAKWVSIEAVHVLADGVDQSAAYRTEDVHARLAEAERSADAFRRALDDESVRSATAERERDQAAAELRDMHGWAVRAMRAATLAGQALAALADLPDNLTDTDDKETTDDR